MSRLRTAYLREMGIDVWVLRENVAAGGGALSRLSAQATSHVKAKISVVGKDAMGVAPEDRRAGVAVPDSKASPTSLAASAPEVVRAAERGPVAPSIPPQQAPLETVKKVALNEVSSQVVADPEFLMCLLDFNRDERELSCLFFLPYSAKGLSPGIDRFAADVAIACLGGPSEPKRSDLRWPMVKSSHIAQSADDARQVVASKVKQCGRDVLVFGPAALSYCGIASGSTAAAIGAHGKRFWPLAEVDHYNNDTTAQAKISLWRALASIKAHGE
jgi:hypothetical protein